MRWTQTISMALVSATALALTGCATTASHAPSDVVRRPGSIEATMRRQTVLSPDGAKLYFNHRAEHGVEVWTQTGANGTPSTFATDAHSLAIEEISPDGLTLAVLTTDAAGLDNGLQLRATNGDAMFEVEPLVKGRQTLGVWFDNAASMITYVITSASEQRSRFMQLNLKDRSKKTLFTVEGAIDALDCWGDGVYLFRREGAGDASELLVWLGEETGVVSFKPSWLPRAKDVRFADKPDHFLVLKTDDDGVNRVYSAADESHMVRVSDFAANVEQFVIDHRRFRIYTTSHRKGDMAVEALDAKTYLPYGLELPPHPEDLKIDRTSRYGRFLSLSTKAGLFVYDWKDSTLAKWLSAESFLP